IWIEASEVFIENSQVWTKENSPKTSTGIYITGSPKITISNSKVFQNNGNGVNIKNSPEVKIEYCDIYDNGSSSVSYPQIRIEASKVWIENSKIWIETKNIENKGIYIKSGAALLHKVSTWGHSYYGMYSKQRFALALYECDVKDGID
ncbi:MAG: right-handed parallel beta-helix repeat-containing protein, partial [bacterium]|nr:right-handed parallel beta-helix repeat-containing protein [bacterium]